jgi:hypothetical protein
MESKYLNGRIYIITDIAYTKKYYGSTVQPLSTRMAEHRRHYKQYLEGLRKFDNVFIIFDEYGLFNCKIELVDYCPCQTKDELDRKVSEYIKENDCINKRSFLEVSPEGEKNILEMMKQLKDNPKRPGADATPLELNIGGVILKYCDNDITSYLCGLNLIFSWSRAKHILKTIAEGGNMSAN